VLPPSILEALMICGLEMPHCSTTYHTTRNQNAFETFDSSLVSESMSVRVLVHAVEVVEGSRTSTSAARGSSSAMAAEFSESKGYRCAGPGGTPKAGSPHRTRYSSTKCLFRKWKELKRVNTWKMNGKGREVFSPQEEGTESVKQFELIAKMFCSIME